MSTFSVRRVSEATVDHPPEAVWAVLTDPEALERLTPLVRRITVDGDRWHWQLVTVPVLSESVQPAFTEVMDFEPHERITFSPAPDGPEEMSSVDGVYELRPAETGTHLGIDLTVGVRLPLPRLVSPAVRTTIGVVLTQMGDGFARNLERRLSQR